MYSKTAIEPTDASVVEAAQFVQRHRDQPLDGFLAIGGGSVMDTAKVANLLGTFPERSLLDFVNAPVGKGLPVPGKLRPFICVPTTSGTGSETTGTAIFDYLPLKVLVPSRLSRPSHANPLMCGWLAGQDRHFLQVFKIAARSD